MNGAICFLRKMAYNLRVMAKILLRNS